MSNSPATAGFALIITSLVIVPGALGQRMEHGVDRSGSDYRDFELRRADPELCRAACTRESQCQAWTYVKPGAPGERAHCWLKDAVPEPNQNEFCVSGVKGGTSSARMEQGMNRPGGDYRDFEINQPRPALCQAACARDGECVSWTYVKPGVQGDKAHCWLKNEAPEAVPDENCTSGLKGPRR